MWAQSGSGYPTSEGKCEQITKTLWLPLPQFWVATPSQVPTTTMVPHSVADGADNDGVSILQANQSWRDHQQQRLRLG